ncbi:tRNA (guanosine(37)-N1)-methyltransferase TrmD [Helicobacter cholecystus]|uniref:tRNA (guanine-N(1)-)-methyltransferase n=1 Tax=Helicobacter cholecystus TaxID=45498 RepID=A0A3D8IWU7_9HELI|nr:tRNA (guanosine(37)-N1)-methyltransferase TrmD [Helicobacter cholecystus]RDU69051.1 tRNA (guanosine(37)-N1)-methyltransferase TrmD [Helicobacter cholecystus]VEJ24581.1 tRNA (guanine-N1)-methyltransferase [Helicobacter cholecystus]
MRFTFLTLFPHILHSYFCDSILSRAIESGKIKIDYCNFRDFAFNRYGKVDEPQIGGGAGQVICADVLDRALQAIAKNNSHIIFLTPSAPQFTQSDSIRLAREKEHIIFVCGRYEGFDERVIELWADEVFCIGDFILTGGELPALCLCDSISRQIKGVLGNSQSLCGESFENHLLEPPIFAKTIKKDEKIEKISPPLEFFKGNHSKISDLKLDLSALRTKYYRPDLYQKWKNHKDRK